MKKIIITTLIIPLFALATAQSSTEDIGIIINGVKWATRNVDEPGTFAKTPESFGKFYQWNRKKAWNITDEKVTDWDVSIPEGTKWTKTNDPSPAGWRVPNLDEIKKLFDPKKVNSEWTIQNGVSGFKFTDKVSNASVFFPAVGYRIYTSGALYPAGQIGRYWSNMLGGLYGAYDLFFLIDNAGWGNSYRRTGFSVRSVAE